MNKKTRILVVEDDPHFMLIIGVVLSKRIDYEVSFASTYDNAIEFLKEKNDVVLLDYYLDKEYTAEDLIDYINCPIIVFTGCENNKEIKNISNKIKHVLNKSEAFGYLDKLEFFIDSACFSKYC